MSTIGAALIVKNEKELLAQCLTSLKGVDEIFIADTGSIDNTVEIAKSFTSNVHTDFVWNDSFCDARNFIKSKVTTDWILSIDADEVLHDFSKVKEAILIAESQGITTIDCTMIASNNGQSFEYPRLFRNIPQIYWVGNIHNHLSVEGVKIGDVRITHGYSPAHDLDPDRALRILEKEVNSRPDAVRETFYLGREYFYRGKHEESIKLMREYVEKSRYLEEKAEAFLVMARAYWTLRRAEEARDAILQAIKLNANFKEALVFMCVLAGKGTGVERWEKNATQWEKMAEIADNSNVLFVRNTYDFR